MVNTQKLLIGMFTISIVFVAAVIWDASRPRPVNQVELLNTELIKDGVYVDVKVTNNSLISPKVRSQILNTESMQPVFFYPEISAGKVTLGDSLREDVRVVNFTDVRKNAFDVPITLKKGCYKRLYTSELVYPTWFSTKSEFYSYETGEFCVD